MSKQKGPVLAMLGWPIGSFQRNYGCVGLCLADIQMVIHQASRPSGLTAICLHHQFFLDEIGIYVTGKRVPQKMDQNNMNKFFNSSFFAQTPQKDNKQGMFPSNQQSIFGQSQPGFGASGQNPFMQSSGNASGGMKSNLFGSSTPFGGAPSFGSTTQPTQSTGGAFGSSFSSQQPSTLNRFGTSSNTFGNTGNTFGTTSNALGSTATPFGTTGSANPFGAASSNVFGSGLQNSAASQPFSTGLPTNTSQQNAWVQPTATATQYNPFGGSQSSFLGDRNTALNRSTFPSFGGNNGTKDHTYIQRKIREDNGSEVTLIHINGNENYSNKSVDELRSEDYSLGRKPITTGRTAEVKPFSSFGGNTGFGSTPASVDSRSQTTNIFGSTPSTTQFQPFTSANASSQNSFGAQPTSFGGSTSAVSQPGFPQAPSTMATTTLMPSAAQPSTGTSFNGFSFPSTGFQTQPSFPSIGQASQSPFSTGTPSSMQPTPQNQQPIFGNTVTPSGGFSNQPIYHQQSRIDPSDPFLLKDVKFEKAEKEHIPLCKMFPQPIFKEEPKLQKITLSFRPPKSPIKDRIYTIPPIEDLKHMKEVHNLIIGFEEKGRIEYLDTVNASEVTMANIQSKIYFSKESVVVNDPVGVGLNRRARVYVEGVFPYSRSLGDYIRGEQKQFPLKGIQERFVYGLKNDTVKKFVGYEYERGTYVYDVNHF